MTTYGYARVSTDGQTLDSQVEALKATGCEKIFREKVSGARADRPQLLRLLDAIGSGDVLIVSRLDRLARSTRDLLNMLDTLSSRGAAFRSLGDQWADTTTPHGRLMLTVLGGLAEFERELIRARTSDGRARAKARGQHMGRPPALTPHQRQEADKALRAGTATQADLARQFNVSKSTISRLADKAAPSPLPVRPALDAETERARARLHAASRRQVPCRLRVFSMAAAPVATTSRTVTPTLPSSSKASAATAMKWSGELAGIAFDVMLETGILVSPLPLWEDELRHPERFSNPALIANIKREGLRL